MPVSPSLGDNNKPIQFSIIIAARNEAENIHKCLNSLQKLNYPSSLFEVILVDDYSEDDTLIVARQMNIPNIKIIRLKDYIHNNINSYKKAALRLGLEHSSFEHVITIDADCFVAKDFLLSLSIHYSSFDLNFVAGPVHFTSDGSFLQDFQKLDNIGMMAMTHAGIKSHLWYLANGANLSYLKNELQPYAPENSKVASGDDMFAIHQARKQDEEKVDFLLSQNNLVITKSESDWSSFIRQRIRWASKNASYNDPGLNLLMSFIWLYCLLLFTSAVFFPLFALSGLIFKALLDTIYLRYLAPFFPKPISSLKIFFLSFFHSFYIMIFGIFSFIKPKYTWKSRSVR